MLSFKKYLLLVGAFGGAVVMKGLNTMAADSGCGGERDGFTVHAGSHLMYASNRVI